MTNSGKVSSYPCGCLGYRQPERRRTVARVVVACRRDVAVMSLMMALMEVMANFLGCSPGPGCVSSVNFSGKVDDRPSQSIDAE